MGMREGGVAGMGESGVCSRCAARGTGTVVAAHPPRHVTMHVPVASLSGEFANHVGGWVGKEEVGEFSVVAGLSVAQPDESAHH